MSYLKHDFVEKRISSLVNVPLDWEVGVGNYYQLDLKMCQMKVLHYDFHWGDHDERGAFSHGASIVEQPSRILKLNVSLNDLTQLDHASLLPLSQLRALDASLNRIEKFAGVEVLQHLQSLNLSHNVIRQIAALHNCRNLVELNLSMNDIDEITTMPSFHHLKVLHLNNNKLTSLDGLQSISHLQELYVQRNQLRDIVPLSSTLRLTTLNAADNHISSFRITVDVLSGLKNLRAVILHGNPIERDNNYHSQLIDCTSVYTLDNISVRNQPKLTNLPTGNILDIKEATRQAFYDQMATKKEKMEENVRFMQRRIMSVQDEFRDYEQKMHRDLDACLRYLDSLGTIDAQRYSFEMIKNQFPEAVPDLWDKELRPLGGVNMGKNNAGQGLDISRQLPGRPNYTGVKDTDEVLRYARNELAKEQYKHP